MIRTRTKIEAVLAVAFLLAISISSVFAVTRTISDTGDTVDTYIRNSNGKYWAATAANIQVAIYDLGNVTGGKVTIPPGTYNLLTDLTMCSNVWLQGSGFKTVIRQGDATVFAAGVIYATGKNNFTISDMTVDGNSVGITTGYNCITFNSNCKDFIVRNLYLNNSKVVGLRLSTAQNGIVDNIIGNKMTTQFLDILSSKCISVSNLVLQNSPTCTDGIDVSSGKYCSFNNIIINGSSDGIKITSASDATYNCTFNNIIMNNLIGTSSGFFIEKAKKCSFNNIYIQNSSMVISSTSSNLNFNNIVIDGSKGANTLSISGNNLSLNNVQIIGGTGRIYYAGKDVIISHLIVEGISSYSFIYPNRLIITDSIFRNCASYGLAFNGGSQFTISNCQFLNNGGDGIDDIAGTCNNFTISNCYFRGNAKAIDLLSTDNYFMIHGCIADSGDAIDINAVRTNYRRVNDTICVLTES